MIDPTELYSDDEVCRKHLTSLRRKFKTYQSKKLSLRTVRKQDTIIELFIDFLCIDCEIKAIDGITIGMANSYFRRWYISNVGDATESEIKTAVKKFFIFLDEKQGITNEKILNSFTRK